MLSEFQLIVSELSGIEALDLREMFTCLLKKDMDGFIAIYRKIVVACTSYMDAKENSYHMLFLGMCMTLRDAYEVQSNMGSGHGRSDIMLRLKARSSASGLLTIRNIAVWFMKWSTTNKEAPSMPHILIVEDDAPLSGGIALTLQENERLFTQCADIAAAKSAFSAQTFDLIILDVNLPDGSGLELCRWIRAATDVPVLFLTANDTELDIVSGLEIGGDDYITKPFSLAVLRARVSALLRRSRAVGVSTKLENDRLRFDFERMIFEKDGVPVELSKTEQRLLFLLVQNKRQTLSREKLSEWVWPDGTEYVDENALSVAIRRLRGKLEDDPSAPAYIKTVFGIGYTWTAI